jgi:hypothetical protein
VLPHLQTRWPRYLHSDEQEKIEDEMRNKRDRQFRVKKERQQEEEEEKKMIESPQ